MIHRLHASVQAERGQCLFLALAEGNGRTPERNFEVCIWSGFMNGTCCVGACKGLLEGTTWRREVNEERHAGRRGARRAEKSWQ